jgi:putative salt-induced outer membrane protein YdiY
VLTCITFPTGDTALKNGKLLTILFVFLASAAAAAADTVTLKNGDRLTGLILDSDGKDITLKTDFAGELKVHWGAVASVTTDKPIYVVTPAKTTVSGNMTSDGTNIVIHTASNGDVTVPLAQVTVIRGQDAEIAYEKSLHPSWLEGWKGGANLGFAIARGNTETTNLNTGFNADRKTLHDETTGYFSSLYSTDDKTGGGTIANSIVGGIRYDRNFGEHWFGFGSGDFTHDELQGLNIRAIYTGGIGYHLINTPNTTLDLLGGINYTHENYSATVLTPTGPVIEKFSRNLAGVTLGEAGMHKFGKSTTVTEVFYFYPDLTNTGQYRFSFDAGSVTQIKKWFGWNVTFSDRYVSDPPITGTKPNDAILTTGVTFSFVH